MIVTFPEGWKASGDMREAPAKAARSCDGFCGESCNRKQSVKLKIESNLKLMIPVGHSDFFLCPTLVTYRA